MHRSILILCGLAWLSSMSASAQERERIILCLDLTPTNISDAEARILSDAVATRLVQPGRLRVVTSAALRASLGIEVERRAVACDGTPECLIEIAAGLGADDVLTGNAGKVGDSYVVNVAVTDAKRTFTTTRRTMEVSQQSLLTSMASDIATDLAADLDRRDGFTSQPASSSPMLWAGVGAVAVGIVGGAIGATLTASALSDVGKA